jgi:hypothetical protein
VIAVLAVSWRVLNPVQGHVALALAALSTLAPREIALAASKVDKGVRTRDRVMDLILMIERLRRDFPVGEASLNAPWRQSASTEIYG